MARRAHSPRQQGGHDGNEGGHLDADDPGEVAGDLLIKDVESPIDTLEAPIHALLEIGHALRELPDRVSNAVHGPRLFLHLTLKIADSSLQCGHVCAPKNTVVDASPQRAVDRGEEHGACQCGR